MRLDFPSRVLAVVVQFNEAKALKLTFALMRTFCVFPASNKIKSEMLLNKRN